MADLNIWVMPSTVRTLLYILARGVGGSYQHRPRVCRRRLQASHRQPLISLAQSYIKGSSNNSARRPVSPAFCPDWNKSYSLLFCKDNSKLCPQLSVTFPSELSIVYFTLWWHFGEQLKNNSSLTALQNATIRWNKQLRALKEKWLRVADTICCCLYKKVNYNFCSNLDKMLETPAS
jgi:hypothetical protein